MVIPTLAVLKKSSKKKETEIEKEILVVLHICGVTSLVNVERRQESKRSG